MNKAKKIVYILFASILTISIIVTLYIYFSDSFKDTADKYVNVYNDDDEVEVYE